jgi:putative AlgH/UPF0301 family transcriptional regulator
VINRPLNVKLSTVMPEIKELEQRKEKLFLGGPVEPGRVLLLVKSPKTPEDAIPVFGDIYISSSRKELKRLVKSTDKSEKLRKKEHRGKRECRMKNCGRRFAPSS